jgi:hypothetical protein
MDQCNFSTRKTVRKIKVWRGLTTFGRGLFIALLGILTKSAGSLVKEDTFSLILTIIGIITFIAGLYISILGMDGQFREFKEVQFWGKKKR